MNHCRDCNSDYTQPGTCNCFAPGGKRHTAPAPWYPYRPWWETYPYYPPYPPYTWTITTDSCTAGSIGNDVTSDTISINNVPGQWSYTVQS